MFHVPESARVLDGPLASSKDAGNNGAFLLPSPEPGWVLVIIASDGSDPDEPDGVGWEHVSAHAAKGAAKIADQSRVPRWSEMCFLKRTFWEPDDVVMQLHPAESEYVNNHPHVLHLWRPTRQTIPTPPSILVGVK